MKHTLEFFGNFDENIKILEAEYHVSVLNREMQVKVSGEEDNVWVAVRAIRSLLELLDKGERLTDQNVRYVMELVTEGTEDTIARLADDVVCITAKGRLIKAYEKYYEEGKPFRS